VHGLHPPDERDLSAELEETRTCVDEIKGERAAEAEQLSQLVVGISNALVDLGMLPIQDIPQLPKSAWEVLTTAGLIWCVCEKRGPPVRSVGLSLGRPLCPWLWAICSAIFSFLLSFAPRSNCNIHFHTHTLTHTDTHTQIYIYIYMYIYIRTLENLCRYTPEPPCPPTTTNRGPGAYHRHAAPP
jgi:hypothetical protein